VISRINLPALIDGVMHGRIPAETVSFTKSSLVQSAGGGAQFALTIPRTGENNISIEATLNRISGELLVTLADTFKKGLLPEGTKIQADLSGQIRVSGIPNNMSGVADLSSGAGRIND